MKSLSTSEILSRFGCELARGDAGRQFTGVATLSGAGPHDIAFLANPKYLAQALQTRAGAVVCASSHATAFSEDFAGSVLVSREPYAVFARLSQFFFEPCHPCAGHSPQAFVDSSARVDATATVSPFVFVGPGAEVGARTVLYPGVFLGAGSSVGDDCILYPNSVVREGCQLGHRCILNPGAVIGGDGFGFAPSGRENVKIPQMGGVRIGDDVELGSNASIDRGMHDDTTVGAQTKIDSMVQIGHNVAIGESCFLCGLVGVAGSARIGNRVTLAGQVGISGHITLGDGCTIYAQSGVAKDVPPKAVLMGSPARPWREHLRQLGALERLAGQKSPRDKDSDQA